MHLSHQDLQNIDEDLFRYLPRDDLNELSILLFEDLKEAHDRLNQNPSNSSRPPSSQEPWVVARLEEEGEDEPIEENSFDDASGESLETEKAPNDPEEKGSHSDRKKAGKQEGAPGFGRTQQLPVTGTVHHTADKCEFCGRELGESAEFTARTGHYTIDIEVGGEDNPGIRVSNTKHIYGDTLCTCGHTTRTMPHRCEKESKWDVELTEWHLVGSNLMALICFLSHRMRLSRPRIREFLRVWLGLRICVGTINQCIHEAGRAVEPLEESLIEEVIKSELLHMDETSWKEGSKLLWLWVFSTATVTLFLIGCRSGKLLKRILRDEFTGWLMSDGYRVYRTFKKRLRCWAHLLRKAIGLNESLDKKAQEFGAKALATLEELMGAIYRAREGPSEDLEKKYKAMLDDFRECCREYKDSSHEKTRSLAREFLNDWDAIFRILANPMLPLTNNEAEQALRHWVIARRLSHGTRTAQGSRAFALLATVIETCRKRNVCPWKYLAEVIAARRRGQDAPALPQANVSETIIGCVLKSSQEIVVENLQPLPKAA